MDSISQSCTILKKDYDNCFNKWFAESFLKGDKVNQDPCQIIFKEYQTCLKSALEAKKIAYEDVQQEFLATPREKQPP